MNEQSSIKHLCPNRWVGSFTETGESNLLSCLLLAMTIGSLAEQRKIEITSSNTFCFTKLIEAKRYKICISKSLCTMLKETGLLVLVYQMESRSMKRCGVV